MAAALTPTLINRDFQNWLKGALAVLFAKGGLIDLVGHENIDFQRHLLQTVYTQKGIPPGSRCSSCTTANVLSCPTAGFCSKGRRCKAHDSRVPHMKPNIACPNGLCSHIRDAIKNEHRFNGPSWKNTDARKWCSDAFEMSKCFMPPDGYSDKTSLADTDFNGILAVVINNNRFQRKMSVNLGLEPNICTEARIIGRVIRHSANHLLSDQDLMKYIDDLITLLSDPAYLAADVKANDAVAKLKQLKTNTLTIHADDITNVLNESIKTTFDDQQKVLLHDIQEHFRKHENDSVEVIDRKIQESVDKQLAEIKTQTDRGKGELNAEKEKGKSELKLQIKTGKDELQVQLEQGKGELNSKVEKGKVELGAQTEQGKGDLYSKVEKGKIELSDQTEQGKGELNSKVEKGKGELSAQTEQGKYELNSQIEKGKVELSAKTEQGLIELNAQIRQGADELKVQTVDGKDELSSHIAKGKNEVEAKTNLGKKEIEARGKQVLEEISRSAVLKTGNNDDSLLQGATTKKKQFGFWDKITFKESRLRSEFKQELVRLYNEKESMIPAAPLVEDYTVPLTELYVQPPMSAFIKPNAFGQGNKHSVKTPVRSYRELFLNDDNIPYKNLYVEANAGYGKTSFTQKVAMTWCQAQKTFNLMNRKFKKKDLDTLKRFEYLFLLHLRDFQCDMCNLDELIFKFVSQNLPNKEQFSEQFIANILQNKTCLVIIDGLDEWVHPETCKRTPGIPHNNYRGSCTVLTTTRPWKLSTIGLPPNLIDRHLEITQLDGTTSDELKSNAVKLLSENSGEKKRDLTDFDRKVSSVRLGDIRLIPYILLQLICIWFDGLSIGNSKCETYSNTVELTLQRGLNKKNAPTLPTGNPERNFTVPECMTRNALCMQYINLLLKLGKLSFYALFQKIKESSLVIDSTTVLKFLTEQELEFCLKIGLLSQSKDRSLVSVKRYKVYFQHKSIQEFMAALYIASEWNNGTIKSTILEVCSSLSSILEMENLFVFVCGMNPEVYTCISGELQTIVDLDDVTCTYRTYIYSDDDTVYDDATRTMKSYQSMQVQCLQESVRNGNDNCSIHLHDYILTKEDLTTLKIIINFNKCNVKSLQLSYSDKTTAFMQSLDPGVFTSLETLRVDDCDEEPVWLADILTESARTLKCLTLSGDDDISLSAISITTLTGLTCLQSLYLDNVYMTHSNLKCLYAYITQTTTLTQLKLEFIHCSDHRDQYRDWDVTLDLHRLNELKILDLVDVPCIELRVNPARLEKLVFLPWGKMTARASATLWQDLRAAPVLSSLTLSDMSSCQEMIQTIPTLTQLQYIKLGGIDMDDVIPRVSPAMTELQHVVLEQVTMSSAAWQKLFFSVGQLQHPVTVKLSDCKGPSREEWQAIVNVIKTAPTLSLLQDLSIDKYGFADLTLLSRTTLFSSGMRGDASLTEFRTVQAHHQQRTERVEVYEPEEREYKIHESAQAKQKHSVEMYKPEMLESECTLMSSDLLNETENQPVCRLGGSLTMLNIYFRNNQVPRHIFSPKMLEAFSSLLKLNTHLECVILKEMKMGDKELEIVKLSKEDIEQISKYEKGKTNIVQLCTQTIGRQILLRNGTQFDLQDFLIESNSNMQNTFADSVILKLVCFNLVKCNIEIKEAYPSMLGADTLPSLVCFLDRNIHLSSFRGFLLNKRIIDDFVNESSKLENATEKESDEYKRVLKQNFEDINATLAEHSQNLLSKHSNTEAISVSFVKMSGNGAVQICPCIVIYCKFKSAVPYKEDPFPRTLSHPSKNISFQTDVREGYFSLCPYFAQGSKEYNRELAMGCSIGEINKDIAATIGPFADVIETHETCFLTVRHLFLPITRSDDQLQGLKVVQPADCDLPPVQNNQMPGRECGEVIVSVFSDEIDAALVKVADERKPARGHFVTVTREELRKAGLSQSHIPTFDNGDILIAEGLHIVDDATRPILKIGSRTGLTIGQLCTIDGVVKLTNDPLGFDFGYNGISLPHYFRNQLLVRSFHNQPFCLPGDSGSAVFLLDSELRLKCIGIVIGIFTDYQAVITPIKSTLDILGQKYGNRTLKLKQFNLNEMEFE